MSVVHYVTTHNLRPTSIIYITKNDLNTEMNSCNIFLLFGTQFKKHRNYMYEHIKGVYMHY